MYWKEINNSMFDFKEFYIRIANLLPNECRVAEIGVADGQSSIFLAEQLKQLGKDFTLHMIDSLDYGKKVQLKTIIYHVMQSGLYDNIEIVPFDSLNASCRYPDGYFDFVFIDSSHEYNNTIAEIILWHRKIVDGGILAGHDIFSEENPEVRKAVDELLPEMITRFPLINENPETGEISVDKFEPEKYLYTEQTENKNGIWYIIKRSYFKPV